MLPCVQYDGLGIQHQSLGFHYELIGTGFQLGTGWGV